MVKKVKQNIEDSKIKEKKIIAYFLIPLSLILIFFILKSDNNKINNLTSNKIEENNYKSIDSYFKNLSASGGIEVYNLLKTGNYKNAVKKWEKKYKDSKGVENNVIIQGNSIMLASAYLNYGTAYYKEEEYALKARLVLNSTEIDTKSIYYNYYIGYSYEIVKDFDNALKHYNKALENSKENYILSILYNQIGHIYDLKGDYKTAYEKYLKAYSYDKNNLSVLTNVGRKLVRFKKTKEAASYFRYAIDVTDNNNSKSDLYYSLSSIILYSNDKNNIEEAFKLANKSIELNPDNSNGYMIRGKILSFAGKDNYNEAINSLNKAIELYKYNYSAYETLGIIQLDSGKYNEALISFNKAYEVIPKDISLMNNEIELNKNRLLFYLSLVNSELGNNINAIKNLTDMIKNIDIITFSLFNKEIKKDNYGRYSNIKSENDFLNIINNKK